VYLESQSLFWLEKIPIPTTQHVEKPTRRPLKILFIKKNSGIFLGFLTLIPKIKH